jgi:L-fuconolactonase
MAAKTFGKASQPSWNTDTPSGKDADRVTRTIDAHHHFWRTAAQDQPWRDSSHQALAEDFGPEDLAPELAAAGIDATVLIQSVDEPAENDRLAAYAHSDLVAGVVAWLPLADPAAALAELDRISISKLSGVRTLIARDPLDWLVRPESLELFREIARRGLAWDVVPVTSEQITAVGKLADAVPELRMVIDHLGRPPLDTGAWQPWAGHLTELAGNPSVAVKVSVGIDVLTTWDSWRGPDLLPYVEWVGARFGASRLMLASNWPVVLLKSRYGQAWSDLSAVVAEVFSDPQDRALIRGGTAENWYRLPGGTASIPQEVQAATANPSAIGI